MTRRRRRTKPRRSRVPKTLTNQYDVRSTHLSSRRRLSSLDRKIYRIAHDNNATRQRIFTTKQAGLSGAGSNNQNVFSASLGGFSTGSPTGGDITRIMVFENLTPVNDMKIYMKSMTMNINMKNTSGVREQIFTVYKIYANKRFGSAVERNIFEVLGSVNGIGPSLGVNQWTPFLPVDKISQYGLRISDITKYSINPTESASYTDTRRLGSKSIASELQGTFGDNEPGVSVHYLITNQDSIGDSTTPVQSTIEFTRKYTYCVEGVSSPLSTINVI